MLKISTIEFSLCDEVEVTLTLQGIEDLKNKDYDLFLNVLNPIDNTLKERLCVIMDIFGKGMCNKAVFVNNTIRMNTN